MSALAGQNVLVLADPESSDPALVLALLLAGARVAHLCDLASAEGQLLDAALAEASLTDRARAIAKGGLASPNWDEACVDALFEQASAALGEIHAVVASHSLPTRDASRPLHEWALDSWQTGLSLGLRNPFLVSRRAVDEFLAGSGGRLVHVLTGGSALATHAAASALAAFTRSIAREYGRRKIACNGVLMQRTLAPRAARDQGALTERAHGSLAQTALFLASVQASFVNGETFVLEE